MVAEYVPSEDLQVKNTCKGGKDRKDLALSATSLRSLRAKKDEDDTNVNTTYAVR